MARSYGVLKPGRDKIDVCLRNHSAKQINFLKKTAVGEITAVNIVSAPLGPNPTGQEVSKCKATTGKGNMKTKKNYWAKFT